MGKPKQLRDQIAEVNAITEEIRKVVHGDPPDAAETLPANESTEPAASGENPVQQQDLSSAPEAAPTPAAEPTAAPAATPTPDEPWEQRYRVLQGKYDAEVPRLNHDLQAAMGQISGLQAQIQTLADRQQAPAPEQAPASEAPQFLTSRDTDDYGAEMVDFVGRAARQAVGKQIAGLEQKISDLTAQMQAAQQIMDGVRQRQATSEASAIDTYLNQHAPAWRDLDNDPRFLAWANQVDPFSGTPKLQLLRSAYAQGDAARVAHIFNAFTQENGTPPNDPVVTTSPAPVAPAPARAPQVNMETLVTPAPSSGAGQPAPADTQAAPRGRIWTQQEIAEHFQKVTRGVFRGRPEEQRKIEEDISRAGAEGRVRRG